MGSVNVEQCLAPIDSDRPSGVNLDEVFNQSHSSLKDMFKQRIQSGPMGEPPEEPNWKQVLKLCEDIFSQSKDLRVCVWYAVALTEVHGFEGLTEGLKIIRSLIDGYWETFHPQLDPDDYNDPLERIMILSQMSPQNYLATDNDPIQFIRSVIKVPIIVHPVAGKYNFRHVLLARQEIISSDEDERVDDLNQIEGIMMESDVAAVAGISAMISECLETISEIDRLVTEKTGGQGPSFSNLEKILNKILTFIAPAAGANPAGGDAAEGTQEVEGAVTGAVSAVAAAPAPKKTIDGQVNSTADVIKAIDMICSYYKREEPSSPVPLLLNRAKKLVSMDFLEIVQEICPNMMPQIVELGGSECADQ